MSSILNSTQRIVPGLIEPAGSKPTSPLDKGPDDAKFSEMVTSLIESVNELGHESAAAQKAFLAGEPVEVLVNQKTVALGEVVVVDENFGVRVTQLMSPEDRIKSLQE